MSKFIFILSFLLLSILTHAQDIVTVENAPKKVVKLYDKAEKCFQKGKTEEGISKLQEAIDIAPNFLDAYLKLGGINYANANYKEAYQYFSSALNLQPSNVKILRSMALSAENVKDYHNAIRHYETLLDLDDKIKPEYRNQVLRKVEDFRFRENAIKNPVPFDPKPLSPAVNSTSHSEYSPSLTANGRRLFFTRVTNNQEDIYYTEKDSTGMWLEAKILPNLNTYENEGAHNISADGKTILFTFCSDGRNGKARGCNIYAAFKKNGKWSAPQYFDAINSKSWDTQPNISSDGNTIIFASKRTGGEGESDLWWSRRNAEGKWDVPQNLGSTINTPHREESPFFHPDGTTLFFKSEGHPGMGSFDLFKTNLNEDGTWSEPINLGYPINTEDHEGAMIVSLDGKTAYYSRGNGAIGFDRTQSDLFTFTLPEHLGAKPVGFVEFRVFDAKTKIPLTATINLQSSKEGVKQYATDTEGTKLITLPLGADYSLNIDKEGYYFHSERFELTSTNSAETAFEIDVYLQPIEEEVVSNPEPIVLKNVLFETGSYELLEESYFELGQLISLLTTSPNAKIEIRGHTDDVGDEDDNLQLSENRAKAVNDYLIQNGISKDRLTFVGLGESQPLTTNDSEEGRKFNRRTEFIIVE